MSPVVASAPSWWARSCNSNFAIAVTQITPYPSGRLSHGPGITEAICHVFCRVWQGQALTELCDVA
jgi:hypothetical protein